MAQTWILTEIIPDAIYKTQHHAVLDINNHTALTANSKPWWFQFYHISKFQLHCIPVSISHVSVFCHKHLKKSESQNSTSC